MILITLNQALGSLEVSLKTIDKIKIINSEYILFKNILISTLSFFNVGIFDFLPFNYLAFLSAC